VRRSRVQLIERSLAWHYQVEQARAERSQYPNLASIHQVVRMEGCSALPAEAVLALADPASLRAQILELGGGHLSTTSTKA
jgi:hypothetical protein